jgi:hypothetical protein
MCTSQGLAYIPFWLLSKRCVFVSLEAWRTLHGCVCVCVYNAHTHDREGQRQRERER